jgi:protein phosphatase
MPWSYKAQELLRKQYASVGAASRSMLGTAEQLIARSSCGSEEMADLIATYSGRIDDARRFADAYRHYCWNVASIDDIRLAPFHILASEGHLHLDRNHVWHMETLHRLAAADSRLLVATNYLVVELESREASAAALEWWLGLTLAGGEGMVVKPLDFIPRGNSSNIQPAVKCRGREYLRIIYGPEYSREEHLVRLRKRGLTNKRSMALREFYLGVESLERFIRREPLRRVHECVFGVLAMESEPVDPRL